MLTVLARRQVEVGFAQRLARSRVARRRFATATQPIPPSATGSVPPPPPPPKPKRKLLRRLIFYTTALTVAFYGGSVAVALTSEDYRQFFTEHVPLGEQIISYTDEQGWDRAVVQTKAARQKIRDTAASLEKKVEASLPKSATDSIAKAKAAISASSHKAVEKAQELKNGAAEKLTDTSKSVSEKLADTKEKAKESTEGIRKSIKKKIDKSAETSKALASAKEQALKFEEEIQEIVRKAEEALKTTAADIVPIASVPPLSESNASEPGPAPEVVLPNNLEEEPVPSNVYPIKLPLGFEPPPGYVAPNSKPTSAIKGTFKNPPSAGPALPLVAPRVSSFASSEPVIGQLAATIDALTVLIRSDSSASDTVKAQLERATSDLSSMATRIDEVKADERSKLEKQLEAQAQGYNRKLLEMEMSAQNKLDAQEEGWRTSFDEERAKIVASYREKLEAELEKQSEIINERLKSEVISQGVDLQRRWMRELKVRVEQEREGRLSKLEELASSLRKLERLTLDNSAYLDDNVQLHALWSSLRALSRSLDSPVRKPFREELSILRNAAAARDDVVIQTALDSLESSVTPDVGVEPFADLASWFSTAVAPRLVSVALVPDQNAGVLSHLASHLLSSLQFRRSGLVEGNDVLSIVSRAEYHLNEKNLDAAARELNQLHGTTRVLLSDWLDAARRRLEVQQAIEVIQAQATLSSLLIL